MEFTTLHLNNLNLNLVYTNKFKCMMIEVTFKRLIKKEEITKQRMLNLLLIEASKEYTSKLAINMELEKLYGANLYSSVPRIGTTVVNSFVLDALNEEYSETGILRKYLKFLNEIIFNPAVIDGEFLNEDIQIIKNRMKYEILTEKNRKNLYCRKKLLLNIEKDAPFNIDMNGYVEDIDSITGKDLYEYYLDMLANDELDIWVSGNIDCDYLKKSVEEIFTINRHNSRLDTDLYYLASDQSDRKDVVETDEVNSTNLNILFILDMLNDYEREFVFPIFENIVCNMRNSKLMSVVRQQQALCYSIYTTYYKYNGLFAVSTGISGENIEKVLEAINQVLSDMCNNAITDKELENAKEYELAGLNTINDHVSSLIDYYYEVAINNRDSLEIRKERINMVSKEDIIAVAKKLKYHSTFTLNGGKSLRER